MNQGFYCETEPTHLGCVAGEEMDRGSNLWVWVFQALKRLLVTRQSKWVLCVLLHTQQ